MVTHAKWNQSVLLPVIAQFKPELRVIRVISACWSCPPEETAGLFASWSHDQGTREWIYRPVTPPRLSVRLHSCTEQLYTRLSTRPVFLVFVSVKKILHLYLQQLNRGQLSTCVVWWRVSEFDAIAEVAKLFSLFFFYPFKRNENK